VKNVHFCTFSGDVQRERPRALRPSFCLLWSLPPRARAHGRRSDCWWCLKTPSCCSSLADRWVFLHAPLSAKPNRWRTPPEEMPYRTVSPCHLHCPPLRARPTTSMTGPSMRCGQQRYTDVDNLREAAMHETAERDPPSHPPWGTTAVIAAGSPNAPTSECERLARTTTHPYGYDTQW
jgi:hypothetical protein